MCSIVKCCKHIMKTDPFFFEANQLDAVLWKEGFYASYQYLKMQLRAKEENVDEQKAELRNQIISAINDGIAFYTKLLDRVVLNHPASTYSIYIRLGDLHRYLGVDDLSGIPKDHDHPYKKAKTYYSKARALDPHRGMAYHGLGLIATYEEAHCRAIYYYVRSAVCRFPQKTAVQNIRIEFANNEHALRDVMNTQNLLTGRTGLYRKESVNV